MMIKREILFGILMFVGFTVYYEAMRLVGLYTDSYLRLLNFVIQFVAIYALMKSIYKKNNRKLFAPNMLSGIRASLIGVLGFSLFIFSYLSVDEALMQSIQESSALASYLNPLTASVLLFTEGMLGAAIATFISYRMLNREKIIQGKLQTSESES